MTVGKWLITIRYLDVKLSFGDTVSVFIPSHALFVSFTNGHSPFTKDCLIVVRHSLHSH